MYLVYAHVNAIELTSTATFTSRLRRVCWAWSNTTWNKIGILIHCILHSHGDGVDNVLNGLPHVEVGLGTGLEVLDVQMGGELADLLRSDLARTDIILVPHEQHHSALKGQFSNLCGPVDAREKHALHQTVLHGQSVYLKHDKLSLKLSYSSYQM